MQKKDLKKIFQEKTGKVTQNFKKINATNVRQNFQEVIDKIHYTKEAIIISKHGKPWVVIQPLEEKDQELTNLLEEE